MRCKYFRRKLKLISTKMFTDRALCIDIQVVRGIFNLSIYVLKYYQLELFNANCLDHFKKPTFNLPCVKNFICCLRLKYKR